MVVQIFKQLKKLNSVKDKEKLLKANKSNTKLLELLKVGLDTERMYQFNKMPGTYSKISKYTADGSKSLSYSQCHTLFLELLNKLENREISGNEAKEEVKCVFSAFDKDTYDLFSKILCKKSLGLTAKTVNKVWPGAIQQFNLMLGPNEVPDLTKLDYPLYIQAKRDGYRCVFKEGELITRHGKKFKNRNLLKYFDCLNRAGNYVLDGELYMHGKPLNEHTEVLNSFEAVLPASLKFYIFDVIPVKDWNQENYTRPYKDRLKDIRVVTNELIAEPRKCIDVHTEMVYSASEAIEKYKKYLTDGYEGAILRNVDSLYKWKRTTVRSGELIKLKPKETIDVKIVEIFDGKDDFKGMAGGVVAITSNNTSVRVGSGWDLATRKAMAAKPSNYVGKTIEITVMEKSKNSYRDPRFKRFRPDKDR